MVDETQDPKSDKNRHQHFKAHAAAVVDAAKAIGVTATKLQKTNKLDERDALHGTLSTQVAELHAAVNNATADPPPPPKENTGGVAKTDTIDQPGAVDTDDEVG